MPKNAKTAPASATPTALKYLESYLDGKPNRKKATAALLGCSDRQAARIISKRKPYAAPMKMAWVSNICTAVGRPIGDALDIRKPRTWAECLVGWNHATTVEESLQLAADCALAISRRAMTHYKLSGSFGLRFPGGLLREVVIMLSPTPELSSLGGKYTPHRIVLTAEKLQNGQGRVMMIQHVGPGATAPEKNFLTAPVLERTLARIHALTKNIPAELQRETTARFSTSQPG